MPTSRIPGFHRLAREERLTILARETGLSEDDLSPLAGDPGGVSSLTENAIGTFPLPLGVATNFLVNGRDVLVPMAVEESSVIAAASNGAKMARAHGGFRAEAGASIMIAQVHLAGAKPLAQAREALSRAEPELRRAADDAAGSLPSRGGGFRGFDVRDVDTTRGRFLVVHVLVDVVDAMGANAANTIAEALAPRLESLLGGDARLRILSNLADRRLVRAEAVFDGGELGGPDVVEGILDAWALADADPYRAATHNKGILNGVDAVVVATGNDWRATEAGAHAYAARDGRYRSLTRFEAAPGGHLRGVLVMPLALGTVGGATRAHPSARAALRVLGAGTSRALAEIAASVGLAQNVAALRALSAEGIQRGHLRLHAKNYALEAGVPKEDVDAVVARMVATGRVSARGAEDAWREINGGS